MITPCRHRFTWAILPALAAASMCLVASCSSEEAAPGSTAAAEAPPDANVKEHAMSAEPALPDPAADKASEPKIAEINASAPAGKVHACAGAGRWFPADPDRLGRLVDAYLSVQPPDLGAPPVALIVPHAGYQYSGSVAGKAYVTVKGGAYKRVILIGLSHQMRIRGATVLRVDAYETPLGSIPVDIEARDALLRCPVVTEQPAPHKTEHSCENQLPFLQRAIKDFRMVELLVGDLTDEQRSTLADAVRPLAADGTLLAVSSDFTHYGPNYGYVPFRDNIPKNLQALNNVAVYRIIQMDLPGFKQHLARTRDTICGRNPICLLLKIVEPWQDVRAAPVAMDTSGRQSGDWTNSVTYTSLAFWRAGEGLTEAEKQTLLRLARDTVSHFLKTGEKPKADAAKYQLTAALKARGAVFVTLKNAGRLRGCIGHIVAIGPLYESVIENACQACKDHRFVSNPITEAEAPALTVEISVLSPTRRVHDLETIVVGRDGLIMARGRNRGVFLPQVPGEQGWDRTQYLTHLCGKAGLPSDAWKDPETEVSRFTAQVFHEEKRKK